MFSAKVLFFLGCAVAIAAALPNDFPVFGGVSSLSGSQLKEAEDTLKASLTKLAAGDGPNYKLSKVISATHQVVSGSAYTFKVELIDDKGVTKPCDIKIWSQSWLENGIEVTFNCKGDEQLVKKHSA